MREKAVLFGRTKSLVGIVTEPAQDPGTNNLPAIILLNAGMLHRVGPNRFHVKVARKMAEAGFVSLRFDFSGIGDSSPRSDNLQLDMSAIDETQQAMNYLSSSRNKNRFILMGICSGADFAFIAASEDPRVIGAVMINGVYIPNEEIDELRPRINTNISGRYYRTRLLNYKSWWRFLTGKSDTKSIKNLLISRMKRMLSLKGEIHTEKDHTEKEYVTKWRSLIERGADVFLIYSDGSIALDAFRLVLEDKFRSLQLSGKLNIEVMQNTDHVFTLLWSQKHLLDLIDHWARDRKELWLTGQFTEAI